jgi:hypothetical protein
MSVKPVPASSVVQREPLKWITVQVEINEKFALTNDLAYFSAPYVTERGVKKFCKIGTRWRQPEVFDF